MNIKKFISFFVIYIFTVCFRSFARDHCDFSHNVHIYNLTQVNFDLILIISERDINLKHFKLQSNKVTGSIIQISQTNVHGHVRSQLENFFLL